MNAPQLYVIHTLPILFTSSEIWRSTIFLDAESHRIPICKESHNSFTRVITEDINPLIYLGHAARLCEEIFHVTNTTIKGFLLPLGCIKSYISQMWTQKILSSPTSFDFCKITTWGQMSVAPDKEGMFLLTRCWLLQLSEKTTSSFYLPSGPSNYFKINLAISPLCYSCGWKRWLAGVVGSCKYVTYTITVSHR